jgi:WD40 repeat protein
MKTHRSIGGASGSARRAAAIAAVLVCVVCIPHGKLRAQEACVPPSALTPSPASDIFTPQQEVELGDVLAEQIERDYRVIHDDDLAGYANEIAKKIVVHLPPSQLDFRVFLFNLPVVNALSLSGGRIYVSRKMVAYIRNEDELAALLSHEMGHILTHQSAIQMTMLLHKVLGLDSVGDRKDISDKINRLYDNLARNPSALAQISAVEERNQDEADKIALYALASAGYSPQTFVEFFNRFASTRGKTGNWLSDIFGETKPDELRLRAMQKSLGSLAASCQHASVESSNEDFLKWQARVVSYSGSGRKESLVGLTSRIALEPPLRTDINYLRFSPDGKNALVQDDSSVFVLSRDPFQLLFRVDASDARLAQFSPNSKSVVILTRGLRLETWDIDTQERSSLHEFSIPGGCLQSAVSYNGKMLACVNSDLDLLLIDAESNSQTFGKKKYFEPKLFGSQGNLERAVAYLLSELGDGRWIRLAFSPDDHYLVGVGMSSEEPIVIDVASHSQLSLSNSLTERLGGGFAFLAPNEIVARDNLDPQKSAVMDFPSGKVLEEIPINRRQTFSAPSRGNYLILTPVKDARVGVLDLTSQKFLLGMNRSAAIDIYDQTVLAESASGQMGLYDLSTHRLEGLAQIPESPLGRLQSCTVSADLHLLAFSARTRGGVWNLSTSRQLYSVRGFDGSYFDGDETFYADFPKLDAQARTIAHASLSSSNIAPGITIDDQSHVRQYGRFLVISKPMGKDKTLRSNIDLEVQDARDGHALWTRSFPKEVPTLNFFDPYDSLVLEWPVVFQGAKEEIKKNLSLQSRFAGLRDRDSATLIEVLDMASGGVRGQLLSDTGKRSFGITRSYAEGDWILVGDNENRTHVFSLSTGEEKGSLFGTNALLSAAAGILLIENEQGQVDVYDLKSLEKRNHLTFHHNISGWSFSADGKRLLVLSANQRVYIFDTQALDYPQNIQTSPVAQK